MVKSSQIDAFTRFTQVSRETITSLKIYEKLLIEANKNLNLIEKSTINDVWERHFLDSAQVIDFIDKNQKYIVDIGTGAGFPGLILAIIGRDRKLPLKIKLFEKSSKKVIFLNKIIRELDLNAEVANKNIFDELGYPKIGYFYNHFRNLPKMQKYLNSIFYKLPYTNKSARFGSGINGKTWDHNTQKDETSLEILIN